MSGSGHGRARPGGGPGGVRRARGDDDAASRDSDGGGAADATSARVDSSSDPGRPFLIGLTGPIGCGKSTVARMLARLGGSVMDADELSREATGPGAPALGPIRARFGDGVFAVDGSLDRAALAGVVFPDAGALADLEAIVHPEVRRLVRRRIDRATVDPPPFAVVEAIKLIEGGLAESCDEVWLIECPGSVQRARLVERGMAGHDIELRLRAQGPDLAGRLAPHATRRIDTSGTERATQALVEDALAEALAAVMGLPVGRVEGRPT